VAAIGLVVVSYNSRRHLRACVERLCTLSEVEVIVVDNASIDGSLDSLVGLPVTRVPLTENRGFAHACNVGWRLTDQTYRYVLFLNPDARIEEHSLDLLVEALDKAPTAGAAGPRIVDEAGRLQYSQRRFPTPLSTYSRAFFLHRFLPRATWVDELIRDVSAYESDGSPDWLSGACLLVRRAILEALGGWDEGFFLYSEDADLCYRIRAGGFGVLFVGAAMASHVGGASAPRPQLLSTLAASRLRFVRKHRGRLAGAVERVGLALEAVSGLVTGRGGPGSRRGHARSLRSLFGHHPAISRS
jgi:N-acetylglucosaminyl-diphospho-decaprenol L-rhamnosyltransferase